MFVTCEMKFSCWRWIDILIISSCQHVFKRNLSELRGNLLGYLDSEFKPDCKKFFPGVCSPYYFIGLRGTVFPHHCEDMDLISVNFMEQGYPKIWWADSPLPSQNLKFGGRDCTLSLFFPCVFAAIQVQLLLNEREAFRGVLAEPFWWAKLGRRTSEVHRRPPSQRNLVVGAAFGGLSTGTRRGSPTGWWVRDNVSEGLSRRIQRWPECQRCGELCPSQLDWLRAQGDCG